MTTWWVPEDMWQLDDAKDGDVLLRTEGDAVLLARVKDGTAEWLGPVPEGTFAAEAVTQATERADLDDAVGPLADALQGLGG